MADATEAPPTTLSHHSHISFFPSQSTAESINVAKITTKADILKKFQIVNKFKLITWLQSLLICSYYFEFYIYHLSLEHIKGSKAHVKDPIFTNIKICLLKGINNDAVEASLSNANTLSISIHSFIVINKSSMISNAEDVTQETSAAIQEDVDITSEK
ncbi:predicted protein [Histoplasma capsulatum H143]|uniref:Uncharacterized protein n=1 Tax=Ajellomyces capsulatus (strain H143) TaxID=544712 RepID=C6H8C3_AJECH|nr:predicted protein [Histoplasma capsulatum H143]